MDNVKKTRILVTGGAGFVGSAMVEKLSLDPNNKIVVVDNLLTGDIDKIPVAPNVKFIKCDVNDLGKSPVFFMRVVSIMCSIMRHWWEFSAH